MVPSYQMNRSADLWDCQPVILVRVSVTAAPRLPLGGARRQESPSIKIVRVRGVLWGVLRHDVPPYYSTAFGNRGCRCVEIVFNGINLNHGGVQEPARTGGGFPHPPSHATFKVHGKEPDIRLGLLTVPY